jgi:hypothetical protein
VILKYWMQQRRWFGMRRCRQSQDPQHQSRSNGHDRILPLCESCLISWLNACLRRPPGQ